MRIPKLNDNIAKIPPFGYWYLFEIYKGLLDYHYWVNDRGILILIPCFKLNCCDDPAFIPKWWLAI